MTSAGPPAGADTTPSGGPGCLTLFGLGIATMVAGWFVAIAAHTLLIDQWRLVAVPREFGFDVALLWAPLFAIAVTIAVTLYFGRSSVSKGRAIRALWVSLSIAAGILVLFAGLGAFV